MTARKLGKRVFSKTRFFRAKRAKKNGLFGPEKAGYESPSYIIAEHRALAAGSSIRPGTFIRLQRIELRKFGPPLGKPPAGMTKVLQLYISFT